MSKSKSKWKLVMVVTCAILMAAGAARAGYKSFSTGIRMGRNADGSGLASGALSHARASSDSTQRMYCYSYATFGTCIAFPNTNTDGIACTTQDPGMLAVIRSVSGDSTVYFQTDSAGNCTNLAVFNDSGNMSKLN